MVIRRKEHTAATCAVLHGRTVVNHAHSYYLVFIFSTSQHIEHIMVITSHDPLKHVTLVSHDPFTYVTYFTNFIHIRKKDTPPFLLIIDEGHTLLASLIRAYVFGPSFSCNFFQFTDHMIMLSREGVVGGAESRDTDIEDDELSQSQDIIG